MPQKLKYFVTAAFEETIKQFKNIDILINNAGILNDAVWEKEILINIVSMKLLQYHHDNFFYFRFLIFLILFYDTEVL